MSFVSPALTEVAKVPGPVLDPDATIPSPHPDDQQRPKRQDADESEPAFCLVHIGRDGFDLIGEEIGQTERQRDADQGGARVRHHELPERHARNARRQKGGSAESHDVPRRDHRLQDAVDTLPSATARARTTEVPAPG